MWVRLYLEGQQYIEGQISSGEYDKMFDGMYYNLDGILVVNSQFGDGRYSWLVPYRKICAVQEIDEEIGR